MKDEYRKLTTKEALDLIKLLKELCQKKAIVLPNAGEKIEFNVQAIENNNTFIVNVSHNNINNQKYTFQGRTMEHNIPLIRLDINPFGVHQNHDGTKIYGTHLHIYNENYDMGDAIPFSIDNPDLYNYCLAFFKKFNIMTNDNDIIYQEQL